MKPYLVPESRGSRQKNMLMPIALMKKNKKIIYELIEDSVWENSDVLGISDVSFDKNGTVSVILRLAKGSTITSNELEDDINTSSFEDGIYEGQSAQIRYKSKNFLVDIRGTSKVKVSPECVPKQLFTPSWVCYK